MATDLPYSRRGTEMGTQLSDSIAITSETAVGSSTTLKGLQAHFGSLRWRYVSGGSIMRMFAEQNNMSIDQFAAFNAQNPDAGWDKKCDDAIRQFGRQNFTIIEGRLPHVFVPRAFHVKLVCRLDVRAERRHKDNSGVTLDEILAEIAARDENDNMRYEKQYPGCLWSLADFDLIVDTEQSSPVETVAKIVQGHLKWKRQNASHLSDNIHL